MLTKLMFITILLTNNIDIIKSNNKLYSKLVANNININNYNHIIFINNKKYDYDKISWINNKPKITLIIINTYIEYYKLLLIYFTFTNNINCFIIKNKINYFNLLKICNIII
jgi:hypothetical protein